MKAVVLRHKQVGLYVSSVISVGGAVTHDASILKLSGDTFNASAVITLGYVGHPYLAVICSHCVFIKNCYLVYSFYFHELLHSTVRRKFTLQ